MDKNGERHGEKVIMNKLPAEIVGRFLQKLSVGDRFRNERVSSNWKRVLQKWGWTEQRKLNKNIVFEGRNRGNIARFWEENLNDGRCQLASLLHRCGPWLRELDLESFEGGMIKRFLTQIVDSLQSLKYLEMLNLRFHELQDFLNHLPQTLCELKLNRYQRFSIETFRALSQRCPNLAKVPFRNIESKVETKTMMEFIRMFPSQMKLDLMPFVLPSERVGTIAAIGQLKALQVLNLYNCACFDERSLVAIVDGCKHLRSLTFGTDRLSEHALFHLVNIAHLTVLEVYDESGTLTDDVLKAIAKRGQLKKFDARRLEALTDNAIVYLVDRCKALVSLGLYDGPKITARSLEAVVAEVTRRHGWPPRADPTDHEEHYQQIFYFGTERTAIEYEKIREVIGENPWLIIDLQRDDDREII